MNEAEERAPDDTEIAALEERLRYPFRDRSWLDRALTHRSVQTNGSRKDYERLEFLGDAVLDVVVAHLLSDRYPTAPEGTLSKMRATLVNTQSLAEQARQIELGPAVRLGRGEAASGGADRPSILADVFEAVIGAVYRDGGYDAAFQIVQQLFTANIEEVRPSDPKTELQELLHAQGISAPEYLLECTEGPEHAPTFVSVVRIRGHQCGRGRGGTKRASQQAAAAEAISFIEKNGGICSALNKGGEDGTS